MKELGPEVARQAEGSQPTQPNPNPNHDRTERPVVAENTSRSSDQDIDTGFFRDCKNANLEEEANPDRTGETRCEQTTSRFVLNVQRGGHRISGLPHSVVKQAENSRVRELVKKEDREPPSSTRSSRLSTTK